MNFFEKIKSFFSKHKKDLEKVEVAVSAANTTVEVESKIDTNNDEIKDTEVKTVIHYEFTDEDKEKLVTLLRPVIKGINTAYFYTHLDEREYEDGDFVIKTLKTFATLSEDKKTLTINLSNSKAFNSRLAKMIKEHVVDIFKRHIDDEYPEEFEVSHDGNGSILILKLSTTKE